jgi:hypothetical protein
MKTLLRRAAVGLFAILALAFAAPAMAAVDCTTATAPNTQGTTANAQFELLQKLCAAQTAPSLGASGVTPVTGTISAVGSTASFPAAAGRTFNMTLYATGAKTPGASLGGSVVYLERSLDSGTTWLPITASGSTLYSFTTLANETLYEGQAGVLFRLTCSTWGGTPMPFGFFQ